MVSLIFFVFSSFFLFFSMFLSDRSVNKQAKRLLGRRVIGPSQQDSGSYIAAPQGPLPLGPHTWRCWDGEQFVDQTATVTLLSQPEVAAAEQRSLAAHSAATMSKKNQVRAQLAVRFLTEIVDDFRQFVDEIWRFETKFWTVHVLADA